MEAAQNGTSVKPLQDTLKTIYPDSQYKDKLAIMDDEQLIEQGKLLSRGVPMGTPVFDGAREADVIDLLEKAGLSSTGQEWLIDGRTGDRFDRPVTVGYIYMLKLHHLVDEKIHARSIGPYSTCHAAAAGW